LEFIYASGCKVNDTIVENPGIVLLIAPENLVKELLLFGT